MLACASFSPATQHEKRSRPGPDDVQRLLDEVYTAGVIEDEHGNMRTIGDTAIGMEQARGLRELVGSEGAVRTVETGFALGFSSLSIVTGLLAGGDPEAHHVAIDPTEQQAWGNAGVRLLARAGVDDLVELIEEQSQIVLGRFLAEQRTFDLAFVDGDHRFDPAMVDIHFLTRLVRPGGLVVVDDMWMPALRVAVAFFEKNVGAELITNALPDSFSWSRRRRRRSGVPSGQGHTAVLRMPTSGEVRPGDHFVPFC